ncbi:MAG: SoxR reducing system RseC family protein [Leucothrix sp.]
MMIQEKALVVSSNAQYAWVSPLRSAGCSGCPSAASCSSSFLSSILKRKSQRTVKIDNLDGVSAGEHVIVGIHSVNLVFSSMLAYLLPVLCLIFFAFIGQVFFSELISIALGVFGLAFGLYAANSAAANVKVCGKLEPIMLGKSEIEEKAVEFNQVNNLLRL